MGARTDYITALQIGVELELLTCEACGISFAYPSEWIEGRRADHKTWYCPNGHPRYFPSKTKEEELRDELNRMRKIAEVERKTAARLQEEKGRLKRQVSAQRGQVTRLRNKAIRGECAFCHQRFPDVAAHVQAEHPAEAEAAEDDGDE